MPPIPPVSAAQQAVASAGAKAAGAAGVKGASGGLLSGLSLGGLASAGIVTAAAYGGQLLVSWLVRLFRDKPAAVNPHEPTESTKARATVPYRYVFGRQRVGMALLAYAGTDGANTLKMAGILGEGPMRKVAGKAWIDGVEVSLERTANAAGDTLQPPNRSPYGPDTTMSTSDPGRQIRAVSRFAVQEFLRGDGTQGAPLRTSGLVEGGSTDGQAEIDPADSGVSFSDTLEGFGSPAGHYLESGIRPDTKWVQVTQADGSKRYYPFHTVLPGWTAAHKLQGRAWCSYQLFQNNHGQFGEKDGTDPLQQFEDVPFWTRKGPPAIELLVEGLKFDFIRWERQANGAHKLDGDGNKIVERVSGEYSRNAAAVRYWFWREVRGAAAEDFAEASWCDEYDYCAEEVTFAAARIPAAFRAAGFRERYGVRADGSYRAPRYAVDYAFDASEDPDEVEDQLAFACGGGGVFTNGGKLVLRTGRRYPTSWAVTDRDFARRPRATVIPELSGRHTALRITLAQNAADSYAEAAVTPIRDAAAIARDGEERVKSITVRSVSDPIAAGRIGTSMLIQQRAALVLEGCNFWRDDRSHLDRLPGDEIAVTNGEFGLAARPMTILAIQIEPDLSATMTLREAIAGAHDDALVVPPLPARPIAFGRPPPVPLTGLAADETAAIAQDGTTVISLAATWTPRPVAWTEAQIRTAAIADAGGEIVTEAGGWRTANFTGSGAAWDAIGAKRGEVWDVWARHLGRGPWTKLQHTISGDLTPPASPTEVDMDFAGRAVSIGFVPPADEDYEGALIFLKREVEDDAGAKTAPAAPAANEEPYDEVAGRQARRWNSPATLEAGAKYYGWVKAADRSGNASAAVATDPPFVQPVAAVAEGTTIWHQPTPTEAAKDPTDALYPSAVQGDLYIGNDGRLWQKRLAEGGWTYTGIDLTGPEDALVIPLGAIAPDGTPPLPSASTTDNIPDPLPDGSIGFSLDGRVWEWDADAGDAGAWTLEGDLTGAPGASAPAAPSAGDCAIIRVRTWPPDSGAGEEGVTGVANDGSWGLRTEDGWPDAPDGNLVTSAYGGTAIARGYVAIYLVSETFPPTPDELEAAGFRIARPTTSESGQELPLRIYNLPRWSLFVGADGDWGIRVRSTWTRESPNLCTGDSAAIGALPGAIRDLAGFSIGSAAYFAWRRLEPAPTRYEYQTGAPGFALDPNGWTTALWIEPVSDSITLPFPTLRGQQVELALRARNGIGPGPVARTTVRITANLAEIQAPIAPRNLESTPGSLQIEYRWTPIRMRVVVRYEYQARAESGPGVRPWRPVVAVAGDRFTEQLTLTQLLAQGDHTGGPLKQGVSYSLRLRAVAQRPGGPRQGESWPEVPGAWAYAPVTATLGAAAPAAPAAPYLEAVVPGDSLVDLRWTLSRDTRIDGWQWRRRTPAGSGAWGAWTLAASRLSYLTELEIAAPNGVDYGYQVRAGYATRGSGASWGPASNERSGAAVQDGAGDLPGRLRGLAYALVAKRDVGSGWSEYIYQLGWRRTLETISSHSGRATAGAKTIRTFAAPAAAVGARVGWLRANRATERLLRLRIRLRNSAGLGPETWVQADTRTDAVYAAGPIIALSAASARRQLALAWQANDASDRDCAGYEYSLDGGATWTDIPGVNARTRNSATVPAAQTLADGTAYTVQLRAKTASGHGPASSATAETLAAAATPPAPGQPIGLRASWGTGQARLTWTPLAGDRISKYQYRRRLGLAGAWGAWADIAGSGPTTDDVLLTGLADRQYCFAIRAVGPGGNGPASATVCGTPSASAPGQVRGLRGTAGDALASLAWLQPSGRGILRYEGRSRAGLSGAWSAWAAISSSATDLTGDVTGLRNGVTYYFQVRAVNATGAGAASAAGPAGGLTPRAAAQLPALGAPTLTLDSTTYSSAWGKWSGYAFRRSDVAGALSYQYRAARNADPTGLWLTFRANPQSILESQASAHPTGSRLHVEVRAVAGARTGPAGSLSITFDFPVPDAPAITLLASSSTLPSATIAWSTSQPAPEGNAAQYPAVTGYQYQQRRAGAAWPAAWADAGGGAGTGQRRVRASSAGSGQVTVELRVRAVASGRRGDNRYSQPSNTISKFVESR